MGFRTCKRRKRNFLGRVVNAPCRGLHPTHFLDGCFVGRADPGDGFDDCRHSLMIPKKLVRRRIVLGYALRMGENMNGRLVYCPFRCSPVELFNDAESKQNKESVRIECAYTSEKQQQTAALTRISYVQARNQW